MRIYRKLFLLSILFIPSCRGEETTDTTVEDAATRNFDTDIVLSEGLNIQDEAIVTINSGVTVKNDGTTGIENGIYDGYIDGGSIYLGKDIDVQVGGTLNGWGTISGYVIRHHEGKAPEWTSVNEPNYYNISLANITKRGNISADLTLTNATDKFFEVIDAGQTDSLARMYRNVYYEGVFYNQDEDETKTKITTIDGVVPQINLCDITSNVDTFKEELKTTLGTIVNNDGSIIFQDYGREEGQNVGQIALQYWPDLRFVYPASKFKIDLSGDGDAGKNYILDTISYYKWKLQYGVFEDLTSDVDIYNFVNGIVTSYKTYVDDDTTLDDDTIKQEYEDTYNTTWETLIARMDNYTNYKEAYENGDFDTLDDTVKANVVTYYVQALDAVWLKTIDSTLPYQSNLQAKEDSYEAKNSKILDIADVVYNSDGGLVLKDNTASWDLTKIAEVIDEEISGYEMMVADINELNTYYNNLTEMNEHLKKLIGEDSTSRFVDQFEQNDALIGSIKSYFSDGSTDLEGMYTNYNELLEIIIDDNPTWDNYQTQSHLDKYIKNYILYLEKTKNIYSGLLNTFQYSPTEPAIDGVLRNDNTDNSAIKTLAIKTGDNRSLYLGGGINFEEHPASLVLGNDEIASGETIGYEDLSKGDSGADNANVVIAKDATFTGVTDIDLYPALALAQKTLPGADGLTSGTELYAKSGSTLIFQEGDAIETKGNWTFRDNSRLISKRKIIVTAGTCITFGEPYASTITWGGGAVAA